MSEITVCQVRNEVDKDLIVLCTEWTDLTIKITIFPASRIPLAGELSDTEINTFAEKLSKTQVDYVEETRGFLTGKNSNVQFFLQSTKFTWKKIPWICGSVEVKAVSEVEVLSDILLRVLMRQNDWKHNMIRLEQENDELKKEEKQLHLKLKEMIEMKNMIEQDLYRRFLVILNTKKLKIRELQSDLQKQKGPLRTVYETQTDESDKTDSEDQESNDEDTKRTAKPAGSDLDNEADRSGKTILEKKRSKITASYEKPIDRNAWRARQATSVRNVSAGKLQLGKRSILNRRCEDASGSTCPVTSDEENPFDSPFERSIPSSMEMEDNELDDDGGKSRCFGSEASTSKMPDNGDFSTLSRAKRVR